jgi:hypothetical protein
MDVCKTENKATQPYLDSNLDLKVPPTNVWTLVKHGQRDTKQME